MIHHYVFLVYNMLNIAPRTVFVSVVFTKIGQVDTALEYFEAEARVQAKWREPLLDGKTIEGHDFKPPWTPKLKVQNIFEEPRQTVEYSVYLLNKKAYVYEQRCVKGKYEEKMELNDFPFDSQSLSLHVTSEYTIDTVEIINDEVEISNIHLDRFSDSQEWTLCRFVTIKDKTVSIESSVSRNKYPGIEASCFVVRKYGFFVWNILVIINFLTIFALATFAVDPQYTGNRLQISLILVLAEINFRFGANQSSPKISYLTLLDRYVLLSMVFSGTTTLWHAAVSRFTKHQKDIDFGAFIVFISVYLIVQVIFIGYTLWQKRKQMLHIRRLLLEYNVDIPLTKLEVLGRKLPGGVKEGPRKSFKTSVVHLT